MTGETCRRDAGRGSVDRREAGHDAGVWTPGPVKVSSLDGPSRAFSRHDVVTGSPQSADEGTDEGVGARMLPMLA